MIVAKDGALKVVTAFPRRVDEHEHVWIPMPDGVRLSARIWLPEDAESDPVPAILEYIPYRKRDGTRAWDDPRHRYWAGHGYAAIRLDIRGTGESEGVITDEYARQEQDDAVEAIAWIAAQPWCSGVVGMTGISWGGFNALQVAARRPPALKAIITLCSTDDRYADDIHVMGGALLAETFSWGSAFFHIMARPADPATTGAGWRKQWMERLERWRPVVSQVWLRHAWRDDYWKHGSVCENYGAIACAVHAVGGWADGYSNAVPRMLANLKCPRKGLVGPWGHKYPHEGLPGPAIGFLQESLRWWDHWLKGRDTGVMADPMYRVWQNEGVMTDATLRLAAGRWVAETAWPSPRIGRQRLHLNARGLDMQAGERLALTRTTVQSVGVAAGSWCPYGLGGTSPDLATDQGEDDGRSMVWESAPLETPLAILGAPVASLTLAVDQPTAFVVMRLADVAPDGRSGRVSYGVLNLAHREGHERAVPVVPGQMMTVTVRLNDAAHRFLAGHRIRVAISTTYWPTVWPTPAPVALTVIAGASHLDLPVRAADAADDALTAFAAPEAAPLPPMTMLRAARGERTLTRDFATEAWVLRLVEDGGEVRYDDIDVIAADSVETTYRIHDDDPLSASGDWVWNSVRRREGWHVVVESRMRVSATAGHFLIATDLNAFEDGRRVFSRTWDDRVRRDGV
jgi:hypothetical protein